MMNFKIPAVSPERIIRLRESAFAADLFITAAGYLDFFNGLNEKPGNLKEVCRNFKIKERPADVMLTLFKAYGLVGEKAGNFSLTGAGKTYLTGKSGYDLTSYVTSLKDRPICKDILQTLRTGKPCNWAGAKSGKAWADSMEDDAFAETFSSAMNSRGAYLAGGLVKALDLTGFKRVLDVGGASGIYTAALMNAFPNLKGTVFEKPPVDKVAEYSLKKLGVKGRVKVAAGDVFKDSLPKGYDVHFISHVLHDWDVKEVKTILKNSYENMADGGIIIVHDAHVNKSKTGPVDIAEYSVLLMVLSEGKCYSVKEMQDLLEEAGFKDFQHKPTILNRSIVTARK